MQLQPQHFRALVVRETSPGQFTRQVEVKSLDDLPPGDLLVQVQYSSLNYKDALSATGHRGVTRQYPHTPGIDAAGVVVQSTSDDFQPGDEIIAVSYDLGMNTPGGFAQYVRIPAAWAVHRPPNLSLRRSMGYGSAGLTAAMCLERLLNAGVTPEQGNILVTGATGGVGSIAVALLAKAGFHVVAATGKADAHQWLIALGAEQVISREALEDVPTKPLLSQQWAGVVDTVGGGMLAAAIKSTRRNGVVTCCGNAASPNLSLTVYPFILRGVSLLGIDCAECSLELRRILWEKLSSVWQLPQIDSLIVESSLDELENHIQRILKGQITGRVIVNPWA